jgi:hypothetical protein
MTTGQTPQRDTCRAPHCWHEYGTPCPDCPLEKPKPQYPGEGTWNTWTIAWLMLCVVIGIVLYTS